MKPNIFLFSKAGLLLFLLNACNKKAEEQKDFFSEARYSIEVTGRWSLPDFTVPAGVHFTSFAGMVHNNNTFLWQENKLASLGVENVAEIGSAAAILLEIDSIIQKKEGLALIFFTPPRAVTSKKANFYCNSNFSNISFVSMIAPSPDWFIGLSKFNLYKNQQWVADTTLKLFVYDAGTEDGDVFGYGSPATVPQQTIQLLPASKATVLANGNTELKHIATVRFIKL